MVLTAVVGATWAIVMADARGLGPNALVQLDNTLLERPDIVTSSADKKEKSGKQYVASPPRVTHALPLDHSDYRRNR